MAGVLATNNYVDRMEAYCFESFVFMDLSFSWIYGSLLDRKKFHLKKLERFRSLTLSFQGRYRVLNQPVCCTPKTTSSPQIQPISLCASMSVYLSCGDFLCRVSHPF